MSNPEAARPVFCVLSDEQREEFERNIVRDLPPSIRLEFESQPDDALDRVGDLDPCLVIVGMTIDPMEGLEFLAMLMARYPNYHEKVLVLPEEGDPFPPMLQYRDRSTGRSTPEEIESDGIAQLIRSIAAPHLESQQVAKPAEPKPVAALPQVAPAVAQPAPAAAKPVAPAAKPPLPAAAQPASPAVRNAPARAATPQAAPPVARPEAAEPPSGVQKVAPKVQLQPAPVRSISGPQNAPPIPKKPGAGSPLANLVMSAPTPASEPKHTGADALVSTMLQGPPPSPPEPPAMQAPPAAPAPAAPPIAAPPRVPAEPTAAAVPPPPPGMALDFAATAPAGAQVPGGALPLPGAAPAPRAPVVLGVKLPSEPQGAPPPSGAAANLGTGVVPGTAPPGAAPAHAPPPNPMVPAPSSLLDKLPLGPLKSLPPEKRWIAWAALATPPIMLTLLVIVLALVMGGSDEPGETSNAADSPTGAAPAKANDADEKAAAAPKKAKKQPKDVPASVPAAPPSDKVAVDDATGDDTANDETASASDSPAERVTVPFAFGRGEHDFTVSDQGELDELVETIRTALKSNPDLRVEVGGHTSEEGSQRFNKLLGRQRADRVTAYLMRRGIPIERIIIRNYGSSLPSESGGNASHRRVTVQLR